jgi:hypothetical protein
VPPEAEEEACDDGSLAAEALEVAADPLRVALELTWETADVTPFAVLVTTPVTAPSRPPDDAGVVEAVAVRLTVEA